MIDAAADKLEVARYHGVRARDAIEASGGFINLSGIAAKYGISKSTAQVWTRKEGFPAPLYVGGQETLWLIAEVEAWRS